MIKLIALLMFAVSLTSCDPGFAVILQNKSGELKNIEVLSTNKRKFDYLDSISMIDSPMRFKIPVLINRSKLSYSFDLEEGKDAVLQQGIGGPDLGEKIIID